VTESEQAAAIFAALNAALAPRSVAYEYGKVPGSNGNTGTEPDHYVVVDISRRYVPERRASGEVMLPGGRVGTRYIGKNAADVRAMRAKVTAALEDQIIVTDAGEIGPFTFESADPMRTDAAFQVAEDLWTF
jgi:hypothetical protein